MSFPLLNHLRADCLRHGHGRKQWWAKTLQVPSLTISHWLSGRQCPNGEHSLAIQSRLTQFEVDRESKEWVNALLELYYQNTDQKIYPKNILSLILRKILSASALKSRDLAFMSYLIERESLDLKPDEGSHDLSNRMGWLLETSGRKPIFPVHKEVGTQMIFDLGQVDFQSSAIQSYLYRQQTLIGKKWKIFDCDLSAIKESFI